MSSRAAPAVVLLASAMSVPTARAAACCVGSTTSIPMRLGECEAWLAGVGVNAQRSVGAWTPTGAVAPSSLQEGVLTSTLAVGHRWDRRGQIGLTAPMMLTHKSVADTAAWGGGPGDLRALLSWDAVPERMAPAGQGARPSLVLDLGARLPTGRSWEESQGALFEDVTGLSGPGVTAGVGAQRAASVTPWSVGAETELGLASTGVQPTLRVYGGIGHTLGTAWTVSASLVHTETWAVSGATAASSGRTNTGLRLTHGQRLRWRAWVGADADLPIPGLGHDALREVGVGAGAVLIR